jgi:hypothetical protein
MSKVYTFKVEGMKDAKMYQPFSTFVIKHKERVFTIETTFVYYLMGFSTKMCSLTVQADSPEYSDLEESPNCIGIRVEIKDPDGHGFSKYLQSSDVYSHVHIPFYFFEKDFIEFDLFFP